MSRLARMEGARAWLDEKIAQEVLQELGHLGGPVETWITEYGASERDRLDAHAWLAKIVGPPRTVEYFAEVDMGTPWLDTLPKFCVDCKGSGVYRGLWTEEPCRTCRS